MSVVLAIGAHPDDVELGCGGTLAKHVADGDEIHIVIMATQPGGADDAARMETARGQAEHAAKVLGAHQLLMFDGRDQRLDLASRLDLVQWVEKVIGEVHPDVVYTHHGQDRNLDHRVTHDAVLTACRPLPGSSIKRLLAFEVPGPGGGGFEPTVYVDITGEPSRRKLEALDQFAREMRGAPHPRSLGALAALALWRGATVGVFRAEAFMLIREVR